MNERSIFMKALDQEDPREQQAYILQACGGDSQLRAHVEALLDSHRRGPSPIGAKTYGKESPSTVNLGRLGHREGPKSVGCPETLRKIMASNSQWAQWSPTSRRISAMKRGPIPGVNIAHNTASRGYQRGETGFSARTSRTPDIAPNTLP